LCTESIWSLIAELGLLDRAQDRRQVDVVQVRPEGHSPTSSCAAERAAEEVLGRGAEIPVTAVVVEDTGRGVTGRVLALGARAAIVEAARRHVLEAVRHVVDELAVEAAEVDADLLDPVVADSHELGLDRHQRGR
jgi:hypothetical protein